MKLSDKQINYLANFPVPDEAMEKVTELYEFLQGKRKKIGRLTFKSVPKLSSRQAFSVIYFLQEHMHLISDTIERCATCKELYDADVGKYPHCDYCRRD